jgi:hypothetical protein
VKRRTSAKIVSTGRTAVHADFTAIMTTLALYLAVTIKSA